MKRVISTAVIYSDWVAAVMALAIIIITLMLAGCTTTITPGHVEAKRYSWDGTNYNSGFIAFTNNGALITPHAAERYNLLMTQYGTNWNCKPGQGLTTNADGSVFIDPQHLFYFGTANRWHKEAKK